MTTSLSRREGVALVIGIGAYRGADRITPLRYAARDADDLADALADPDIGGFPDDQVKRLIDADAHRDPIVHHLSKWLPERSKGADLAVIYFAGHGTLHRIGSSERGFLLPYDA